MVLLVLVLPGMFARENLKMLTESGLLVLIVAVPLGCIIACLWVGLLDAVIRPEDTTAEHVEYLTPNPVIPGDDADKQHRRVLAIREWEKMI